MSVRNGYFLRAQGPIAGQPFVVENETDNQFKDCSNSRVWNWGESEIGKNAKEHR